MPEPLIVTLLLEEAAQQRFDRLREQHFPPERNHLAAHVTLFHALPGEQLDAVRADLAAAADRPAFDVGRHRRALPRPRGGLLAGVVRAGRAARRGWSRRGSRGSPRRTGRSTRRT